MSSEAVVADYLLTSLDGAYECMVEVDTEVAEAVYAAAGLVWAADAEAVRLAMQVAVGEGLKSVYVFRAGELRWIAHLVLP